MAFQKRDHIVMCSPNAPTEVAWVRRVEAEGTIDTPGGQAVRAKDDIGGSANYAVEIINRRWTAVGTQGQYGGTVIAVDADTVEEAGRVALGLLQRGAAGERCQVIAVFAGEPQHWYATGE